MKRKNIKNDEQENNVIVGRVSIPASSGLRV